MGSPKQDLILSTGMPMIEAVYRVLDLVCCRVVVVGDSDHLPHVPRIRDARPGLGPLGGIEALLAVGGAEQYLVVPCDLPHLSADLVRPLLLETDAAATVYRGHPLPARISRACLDVVRSILDQAESMSVRHLLSRVGALELDVPESRTWELANVNCPEDLAREGL